MKNPDSAIIHVQPEKWTDEVHVLIPYRLWGDERLANVVKKAIEMTFKEMAGKVGLEPTTSALTEQRSTD